MAVVSGQRVIARKIRRIQAAVRQEIEEELNDIANDVLSDSRDIAPQLTGLLIRSSAVDEDDSEDVFVRSVFYDTDYAVIQHEGDFNPGPITVQKPGAGRKYLQRAYEALRPQMVNRLGRATERALRLALR